MVKTYNDPAKQKAREKLREFIAGSILKHKHPKEVRVVCLPGAEVEGEEALEVREIYDSLGIPRENITGLEYSSKRAKRLKRANTGIRVIEQDALDFFKEEGEKYDIIFLDYTGQRTWKERDITRYIAGNARLASPGVLSTAHCCKRESSDMKAILADRFYGLVSTYAQSQRERLDLIRNVDEVVSDLIQKVNDGSLPLNEARDYGITMDNLVVLGGGRMDIRPYEHPLRNNKQVKEFLQDTPLHSLDELHKDARRHLFPKPQKGLEQEIPRYYTHKAIAMALIEKAIASLVRRGLPEAPITTLVKFLFALENKAYVPTKIERYAYTSNKNANMLVDMMHLRHFPYALSQRVLELAHLDVASGEFLINPQYLSPLKWKAELEKFHEKAAELCVWSLPEPRYLGTSWNTEKKEKISKEGVVELLQAGFSSKEIAACYKGFSEKQLAALKAHYITMGKTLKEIW